MRRPDIENVGPQDTHVNAAARWENLEKEIIANGFCDGSKENILLNSTNGLKIMFHNNITFQLRAKRFFIVVVQY